MQSDLGYISFEDFKEQVISYLGTKEVTFYLYEGDIDHGFIPDYRATYEDLEISYCHHNQYVTKEGEIMEGCLFTIAKWVTPNKLVVLGNATVLQK